MKCYKVLWKLHLIFRICLQNSPFSPLFSKTHEIAWKFTISCFKIHCKTRIFFLARVVPIFWNASKFPKLFLRFSRNWDHPSLKTQKKRSNFHHFFANIMQRTKNLENSQFHVSKFIAKQGFFSPLGWSLFFEIPLNFQSFFTLFKKLGPP